MTSDNRTARERLEAAFRNRDRIALAILIVGTILTALVVLAAA